ncbi:MAG: CPBP family intramembrane metalloprotease [Flammeovirgaceae bacterium]|nr:CPBP family intramembrane metalloprotease [Flammeovirgaceae bacterium]
MKDLWVILKNHVRQDFNWTLYSLILLFLSISISINYYFELDDTFFDSFNENPVQIGLYFLFFGIAYYTSAYITLRLTRKSELFLKKEFWLLSLAGIAILSFRVGFPYTNSIVHSWSMDSRLHLWVYYSLANAINFLTTALPLVVIFVIIRQTREKFGINNHHKSLAGYWSILLLILPFIFIGSFEPGFKNYYPTYKANLVSDILGWPMYLPMAIYEICYGLDFFNVEFLFRGLMVIGLTHILGKEAILPMVCTYCFLHFGKPMAESISSIAGGYVLGVFAFYTRNIWGGVILHIGVAWSMELAAYFQKIFN